jgi:hypothetical protein
MEVIIENFKTIALNFPKRKKRNRIEKNWDSSKKQSITLEKQSVYFDGDKGGVFVQFKLPPYLKDKFVKKEINLSGYFEPQEKDEEIENSLDIDAYLRLKDIDPIEFLLTGHLISKNSLK